MCAAWLVRQVLELIVGTFAATVLAVSIADAQAVPRRDADDRRAQAGNLVGHGGPIKAISIDPRTGRILTGAFDYAMAYWWAAQPGEPFKSLRFADHKGAVNAVAFARLGRTAGNVGGPGDGWSGLLAAGDDFAVTVWTAGDSDVPLHRFEGHSGKVVGLAVSPDGRTAATASWDRTARLWDLANMRPGPVLEGHPSAVNAVAFSSDGTHIFTASADGHIRDFDHATGKFERSIYAHGWGINVLERLAGGDRLLFGAVNGSAAIIDVATGFVVHELPSHNRPVLAAAVLETSALIATGGGDGVIRVMRADDGAVVAEYNNPYGPVWALAFMPDGHSLYYGGLDDFATLWRFSPQSSVGPVLEPERRRFQVKVQGGDAIAKGEQQFARKCSICHTVTPDGGNRAGPSLYGIFGRRIATLPGYPFSPSLREMELVWSEETVAKLFELGPDVVTPGSKMPLQKMTDPSQRDALIAYLKVATTSPQKQTEQKRSESP